MTAEPPIEPLIDMVGADEGLLREIFAAQGKSFRGGAIENLESAPMGKGHGNAGMPFDLETACYLKPKFAVYDEAIRNGTGLKLVDKSGVKSVKSFSLEVCAADHVCNRNGDCAIFFGSESAAESTATTRILDFFRGIPRFQKKVDTLRSRFDDTMGAIKFPDKTLFILSANLGNTQQKNLGFVGLQDAFVTGATGMIDEMIARTTQYEKEAIVYLESQGGEKRFDFDRHYNDTDQRELGTVCPSCYSKHIFNWKVFDEQAMTRPQDFVPVPPRIIPSLDWNAWIAHHRPLMVGKVAGFQRGDDQLIKFENGDYNEAAVLRETHFECFFCGGHWHDDGEFGLVRVGLDKSSHYIASRLDALPGNIGFNTPQWINRRLSWGKMMLEKLKCQRIATELGNFLPLKQWWQKTAARTWDDAEQSRPKMEISIGSYETDPEKLMPDSHCRQLTVDCGKAEDAGPDENRIGIFWFDIWEWNKQSNGRQLSYGVVNSRELLNAQRQFWKVPATRTFVDCSWMPSQVEEMAVQFFELTASGPPRASDGAQKNSPAMMIPYAWRLCAGAGLNRRLTVPGKNKGAAYSLDYLPGGYRKAHDKSGRLWRMLLWKLTWSNLWFEKQLDSILSRGMSVNLEFIGRDKCAIIGLDGKPDAALTRWSLEKCSDSDRHFAAYSSQLNSRYFKDGKYVEYEKQSRPTEFRDTLLMQLAGVAPDGLLGHMAVSETEEKS